MDKLLIELKNKNSINEWSVLLNRYDICFTYIKDNNNDSRLLLKLKKNNKYHDDMYYYCNGCVIDINNWKYLSIPPIAFNKQYNKATVDKMIDIYDVIKIRDGTVVTFYYYNNKWAISTSKGYDVSGYYWMGDKTYSEIIFELLSKYPDVITKVGIELINDERIHFENLDKNKCYTIGFRHHNFHPLTNDPEIIWNIQHVDLVTYEITHNDGIPGIPNQRVLPYKVENIDFLLNLNKEYNPIEYDYGFILRSKDITVTKKNSNILLDNNLLKKLKNTIYKQPSNEIKEYINHTNRLQYIMLKNFIVNNTEIIQLFSNFHKYLTSYNTLISDTVDCVHDILNNNNLDNTKKHIISLSKSLLKYIKNIDKIDIQKTDSKSIIKNYITNIEYIILFLYTINKY